MISIGERNKNSAHSLFIEMIEGKQVKPLVYPTLQNDLEIVLRALVRSVWQSGWVQNDTCPQPPYYRPHLSTVLNPKLHHPLHLLSKIVEFEGL